MKKNYFLLLTLISITTFAQTNVGITGTVDGVYLNEIHYDNDGADVGEFLEIAGPAGTILSSYSVTLYNGSATSLSAYDTVVLSGTIDDEGDGVGAVLVPIAGSIQNGSPDGFSLSKAGSSDVQFLSYEGSFTAANGAASGLASVDIGVEQVGTTPAGYSLEYDEASMTWVIVTAATPGLFAQGTILSVSEFSAKNFKIYPNPTSLGYVNLTTNNTDAMSVSVFDVLGKQVLIQTVGNNRLNIASLKSGIYIMKISQDNTTITKKLVIK